MGNSAGIVNTLPETEAYNFDGVGKGFELPDFTQVESYCKYGVFQKKEPAIFQQYRLLVDRSIQKSLLDNLELLIGAGRIREVFPLHIAAKYGSIECMELLLSAGFNPDLLDTAGRTPLHYAAMDRSRDSVLCASLLVLSAKKGLNLRDSYGDTAVHLAAKRNNVDVFRVIANADFTKLDIADTEGKSCRRIAIELDHTDILQIIDSLSPARGKMLHQGKKEMTRSSLDNARIMQVWEKFFENAFKAMVTELEADESFMMEPDSLLAIATTIDNRKAIIRNSGPLLPIEKPPSTSSKSLTRSDAIYQAVREWFSWIVFYNSARNETGVGDGYFAIQMQSAEVIALQKFLKIQFKYKLYNSNSGFSKYSPVVSLETAVGNGWAPFFDENVNRCVFMHLETGHCETYLNIGYDRRVPLPPSLVPFPQDESWVSVEQGFTFAWAVVFLSKEDLHVLRSRSWEEAIESRGEDRYYFHRLTGHTSWEEPQGWFDIVRANGGWSLCFDFMSSAYYWWAEGTNETYWAEFY